MVTEDYVSFETAKLLKEKGFEEDCNAYWDLTIVTKTPKIGLSVSSKNWNYKWNPFPLLISAPTLQMAMKWLREVHNIALNVCYLLGMWSYSVYRTDVSSSGFNSEDFDTYEEACEAGIKYCLENLI